MPHPLERRVLFRHIDEPGYTPDLDCYLRNGGYETLKKAVTRAPADLIEEVKKSGLRGRGGAGFPTGVKWSLVDRKSGKPIYLIVNCDESEPGTFKDRYLVHQDPHQLIEGIMITCFANNVKQAYIYIRGEFPHGARILEKAIAEARAKNFVGPNILGTGYSCEIYVHRGAGAYICGEETGLIESIEGKRPYPRIKPPFFPAVLGLYQCPTIVNNVETLCHVRHIVEMGGEAYAKVGTPNNSGTRLIGVSGLVQRPGYYEIESGKITLGQLLHDICGGPLPGRTFKAIIPGGSSAKILRWGETFKIKQKDGSTVEWSVADIPMDFDSFAACGTMGGSGGVIVMDESTCMVRVAARLMRFYAHESCGWCIPCREGTTWLRKLLARIHEGAARARDIDLAGDVARNMLGRTFCPLGDAAAMPTIAFVEKFREEFEAHLEGRACACEVAHA